VGLRAGLDTQAREKFSCLCRGSNLDRSVAEPVAMLTELPRYYCKNLTTFTMCRQIAVKLANIKIFSAILE
jgi:hypothetical protein